MSKNKNNTQWDDARFDRLVDGELNEEERKALLSSLDDSPGGWRQCALAFLEAQCWQQSLANLRRTAVAKTPTTAEQPPIVAEIRRSPRFTVAQTLAAMAACFLMTFWIGSLVYQTWSTPSSGTPPQVATATAPRPIRSESTHTGQNLASTSTTKPWQVVTVASPSGGTNSGSTLRLPAVERDNIDSQWLQNLPSAVPNKVVQALDRSGHEVQQHRELVPVRLQDGRQMVVPVDHVDVHYVGNGPY